MDYQSFFSQRIVEIREEGCYRIFVDIERQADRFPCATHHTGRAHAEVTVWCPNDYLGMGQHPDVLAAMH